MTCSSYGALWRVRSPPWRRQAADCTALSADRSADQVIQELNARHQDYRLVEQDLHQRRVRLRGKLPEIEKAVAAVAMLLERREAGEDVRGLCPHAAPAAGLSAGTAPVMYAVG